MPFTRSQTADDAPTAFHFSIKQERHEPTCGRGIVGAVAKSLAGWAFHSVGTACIAGVEGVLTMLSQVKLAPPVLDAWEHPPMKGQSLGIWVHLATSERVLTGVRFMAI